MKLVSDEKEKMICEVRSATQARVFGSLLCCFERVAQATRATMNSTKGSSPAGCLDIRTKLTVEFVPEHASIQHVAIW